MSPEARLSALGAGPSLLVALPGGDLLTDEGLRTTCIVPLDL